MKLGIMQPYFFPYLGYFELINKVDEWLVFDIVQYNAKCWMNRNRILHPKKGWQYITIPVKKHSHPSDISKIYIKEIEKATDNIMGKLTHYKRKAPYYNETIELVIKSLSIGKAPSLVELNVSSLKLVCEYLDIDFKYQLCSSLNFNLPKIHHPGQWALEISKIYGADEYINLPSGKAIFNQCEFEQNDIKLSFIDDLSFKYDTFPYPYEHALSIIDVIMWNSKESIIEYLSKN